MTLCAAAVAAATKIFGVHVASGNQLILRLGLLAAFPVLLALSGFLDQEELGALKRRLGLA